MKLPDLFSELNERRVFRVAAAYAVIAWLAVQVAEVAFGAFDLPSSAMRILIVVAIVGFPVVVVLAWLYDITPGGIRRAADLSDTARGARRAAPIWRLFAGLAVLALVAWGAVIAIRATWGGPDIGDPRKSLIVFPFENHTPDAEKNYLRAASANLLGLAIGQWEDMRVFDDERTMSLLRQRGIEADAEIDFDAARQLAREAGVGTFVLGELRLEGFGGDSLAIEAKVYDTRSGERLAVEKTLAPRDGDPRRAVDALAARILDVSGAPPGDRPDLVAQTTRSLEAYRAYLRGSHALQLLEIDSARAYLKRAVALDSTFALAYLRLASVDGWAGIEGNPAERRKLVAEAVSHSGTLPPRYRMLVQYYEAYQAGRLRRARAIAEQMIARDSTDVEAWYQLGEAHFHDDAGRVPHADTLGNVGSALRAFETTLALDSSYVLAYRHIIDALGICAGDSPWLCVGDSAVYAPRADLEQEYGAEAVARMRAEARERIVDVAYGWAAAAPTSAQARTELIRTLIDRGRLAEAREQIAVLEALGHAVLARGWQAQISYTESDYEHAAALMAELLRGRPRELRAILTEVPVDVILSTLEGGARMEELNAFIGQALAAFPGDTVNGAGNLRYAKEDLAQLVQVLFPARLGVLGEVTAANAHAFLDMLDAGYGPGSADHEVRWRFEGSTVLIAFLASRDTTLLTRYLAAIDTTTTGSRTWRVMDAELALERGDTGTARLRVENHYLGRDELEIRGNHGAARLFAWADILVRLGELEEAVAAYALYETDLGTSNVAPLQVRSWLARGELYERLGRPEEAVAMYERFIDAWEDGSELVQPAVDEARSRVAVLR